MAPLPRRTFAGKEVSVIGVGCSPFGHAYGTPDEKLAFQAVQDAYKQGINFFDIAPFYGAGSAERLLGRCIADLPREDLFICTKVGKYKAGESEDFSGERVTRSVHESLERLGLKYIDLIICHDIESAVDMKQIVTDTIPALQKLKEQGVIRAIGISGLPLDIFSYVLDRVPKGTVDAALSYCHDNLADDTLQGLVPYLNEKGVKVVSASFSSMGLLTQKAPPSWHPASPEVKAAADKARAICAEKGTDLATISLTRFMKADGIDVRVMGMVTPDEVAHDVKVVRQALGLDENPNARAEDEATQEIEALFKPILNQTWKTGRDNNRTP